MIGSQPIKRPCVVSDPCLRSLGILLSMTGPGGRTGARISLATFY